MSETKTMAFDCPACGETNGLEGKPESFVGRVFECDACGENVLLKNYRGDRDE